MTEIDDLLGFLAAAPSPYHAVARARRRLGDAGFTALDPTEAWPAEPGAYLVAIGGALVTNDDEIHKKLKFIQLSEGAVPGIMECFLLLRSTKTLHIRMERHCSNAKRVAGYLSEHAAVEKVIYPGLESHPQHAIAKKQMRDFGGMVTIYLKDGLDKARTMLERVRIFALAESLGGVESLIEHPAIMTHASVPAEQRQALGISDGLVRLSVGIENVEDLIADLDQALA